MRGWFKMLGREEGYIGVRREKDDREQIVRGVVRWMVEMEG